MKPMLPLALLALGLSMATHAESVRHAPPHHAAPRARQPQVATAINVNAAGPAELQALKGVGEKKARAIVAFRKAHGPFATLDDFEEVPGIGPAMIEANRDRIRFR